MTERFTVPARRGKAAKLKAGEAIRIINTHGSQVVDAWAFALPDLDEFMSMEHTRATLAQMMPVLGEPLYTNRRRAILTLEEDTTSGIHDTLMAACDVHRYKLLGCSEYHDNCTDNLASAMTELGLEAPETPSPLNLFMNIPWTDKGALAYEAPDTKPGDYVVLRADLDCVVAMSTCPQDMVPINGADCVPKEVHYEIVGSG